MHIALYLLLQVGLASQYHRLLLPLADQGSRFVIDHLLQLLLHELFNESSAVLFPEFGLIADDLAVGGRVAEALRLSLLSVERLTEIGVDLHAI